MAYRFHFLVYVALIGQAEASTELSGYGLADAIVPAEEIFRGGPGRDGIPAPDAARFADATSDRAAGAEERVPGLTHAGVTKAYPTAILTWVDRDIVITFDDRLQSAAVRDRDGTLLVSTTTYWFAWYAYHPQTLVYKDAQHDR